PITELGPRVESRLERGAQLLLHAGAEAWGQSGWNGGGDIPVILGTTCGGMTLGEDYYRAAVDGSEVRSTQSARSIYYQAQRQGALLGKAFGFGGEVSIIANACASGANAIGHAYDRVRTGQDEQVLAGGYDALCQMVYAGFDSLQALSTTTCRPFDANRDGLGLGEGAAVVAMETLDHAKERGVEILGEIVGYGAATDVHHLTQPHPNGDAAVATMSEAMEQAGLSLGDIGYLNAHGTGTPLNDVSEAGAINRLLNGGQVAVSSTKGGIGHLLGGAGAVETVICLLALDGQWLPPEPMLETLDPVCEFEVVTEPTEAEFEYAMTNSFGFGGANATLILRRTE
ncbi:MAG: beta-ketoacyl-[acyl-carrier-protein] synthase family protein, partial [Limisphaerales bacterium]